MYNEMQEEIHRLIIAEQARQKNRFIDADVEEYIAKLFDKAQFSISIDRGVCHGFVAYYCNDETKKIVYISLLLVAPTSRNEGLAQSLILFVLNTARAKGFSKCLIEVAKGNIAATRLYAKLGFSILEDRNDKLLLHIEI
jgi:ribosomal protein S18 acetylase RimI-like enzyme